SAANWLYVVAHRLAVRLGADIQRRRRTEAAIEVRASDCAWRGGRIADPLEATSGRELCTALDIELSRLPLRLRSAIVLCCLQGKTRNEAARALGWSLGTLKRRLEQGRALLRSRLEKRGFTLLATLAGALVAEGVDRAVVPAALLQTVVSTSANCAAT